MSSPALQQRGNGRTELVEESTKLKALLRVERNISHAAGVYVEGHTFDTAARENKVGAFLAAAVIPHVLRPEGRRGPSPGG